MKKRQQRLRKQVTIEESNAAMEYAEQSMVAVGVTGCAVSFFSSRDALEKSESSSSLSLEKYNPI
ncbi:MAG: hypothetical protein P1U36_00085 [Legionellaceae bacterium]|nr:hypothetical protein [Legionellaceae bacterium]